MNEHDGGQLRETINQLCKLTEALSVHQRQLSLKIDAIHSAHRDIYVHQDRLYAQVEALFSIHSLIGIRRPLPDMRGWSVSPDFVKLLMSLILEEKPETVVETGSGVSSIICGYCLEKNGQGTLTSYDHDEKFAGTTEKEIAGHQLESLATVVLAPLRPIALQGDTFVWYDPDCIRDQGKIDLLVVDGPPGGVQPLARYPALPVFFDKLSERAVVLVDDAARDDEKKMVEAWLRSYDGFDCQYVDTENGAVVLKRKNNS